MPAHEDRKLNVERVFGRGREAIFASANSAWRDLDGSGNPFAEDNLRRHGR